MNELIIIKIGGNSIDDDEILNNFLATLAQIKQPKILIHGGGKLATELAHQLNIETKQIDGRRITDQATLDVVTMVYAGLINKKIVAKLQKNNCNAVGLTGADGNAILAHKRTHPTIDFGFVGDIDVINTEFIQSIIKKNGTPVLAPITHNKMGNLLNTNADTIASEIAIAFSKLYQVTFIYCFDKKGLLLDVNNDESVIKQVKIEELEQLKQKQIITKGMLPKVTNIEYAINNGVEKVILCDTKEVHHIINGNTIFGTIFTK